jgi:hypothetical protein
MINHVRNTVLSILNKENRGYITPEQFNSYAAHAQQGIFNLYFAEYAKMVSLKNARRLSADYGDRVREIQSNIDTFTKVQSIAKSGNGYPKPNDLFKPLSLRYNGNEIVQIPLHKETFVDKANLTAPSVTYPVYVDKDNVFNVKPSTITSDIELVYVRNPLTPKWTYTLVLDEPVFNPSASDYQDFELGFDDSIALVLEICKLAGVTIREADVVTFANNADVLESQKQNS